MHLNDYQLLELDAKSEQHLSQCKICSEKAKNLATIKQAFGNLPIKELPNKDWQALKKLHLIQNDRIEPKLGLKRRKIWQIISLGMAASALMMVYIPSMNVFQSKTTDKSQQLVILIEESNQLQQRLFDSTIENKSDQVAISLIQSQVNLVDQSIQQAYVQRRSIDEISFLWNQRLVLMKKEISKTTSSNSIRI